MRIASIETIIVDLPTRRPHHLAMATINSQGRVLARIRDENGNEGIGEAPVIPHYGAETVEGIKLLIDDYLGPSVIGQNPAALEAILLTMDKIVKDNAYAKGVVEMACVDLTARSFGVSAAALFGAPCVNESLRYGCWEPEMQRRISRRLRRKWLQGSTNCSWLRSARATRAMTLPGLPQ